MKVARGCNHLAEALGHPVGPTVVTVGNFDGVHVGHQALLAATRDLAARLGGEAGVLTFDPHPARFFAPTQAPPLLVPLARRLELLAAAGVQFTVVEPFTTAFAAVEANSFVQQIIRGDLGARHVVVGYDFSFGRGRKGDGTLLTAIGQRDGMGVTVVPPVQVGGVICSSTQIREFVREGRVENARLLLGRPFEITGVVVRGAGRGRTIGVPTANIQPEGELLPAAGIYAARIRRIGHSGDNDAWVRPAAVSIGTNPTFQDGGGLSVEAHVLDHDGDLYGARLRLELAARLRDEARFPSVADLVAQIQRDIVQTRKVLS